MNERAMALEMVIAGIVKGFKDSQLKTFLENAAGAAQQRGNDKLAKEVQRQITLLSQTGSNNTTLLFNAWLS